MLFFKMAFWRRLQVLAHSLPPGLCSNTKLNRNFSATAQRLKYWPSGLFSLSDSSAGVERATEAHSKVLTQEETVYELECKRASARPSQSNQGSSNPVKTSFDQICNAIIPLFFPLGETIFTCSVFCIYLCC